MKRGQLPERHNPHAALLVQGKKEGRKGGMGWNGNALFYECVKEVRVGGGRS